MFTRGSRIPRRIAIIVAVVVVVVAVAGAEMLKRLQSAAILEARNRRLTFVTILPDIKSIYFATTDERVYRQPWDDVGRKAIQVDAPLDEVRGLYPDITGKSAWLVCVKGGHRPTFSKIIGQHLEGATKFLAGTNAVAIIDADTIIGVRNPTGMASTSSDPLCAQLHCRDTPASMRLDVANLLDKPHTAGRLLVCDKNTVAIHSHETGPPQPTVLPSQHRLTDLNLARPSWLSLYDVRRQVVVSTTPCIARKPVTSQMGSNRTSTTRVIADENLVEYFKKQVDSELGMVSDGSVATGFYVDSIAVAQDGRYIAVAGAALLLIDTMDHSSRVVWRERPEGAPDTLLGREFGEILENLYQLRSHFILSVDYDNARSAFIVVWGDGRYAWIRATESEFFDERVLSY